RRELRRRQAREPRALVGREHAERRPAGGEDLAALEDDVILAGTEADAEHGERGAHARVARPGVGLVVVVGVDGLHAELARERRDLRHGVAVEHDESPAASGEVRVEGYEALANELD